MPIVTFAQNGASDSLAVRKFLDTNGFYFLPIQNFVECKNGRITTLIIKGEGRSDKNIPDYISIFPSGLKNLTALKKINLLNCDVDSIDFALFEHAELETLDISGNKLKEIPGSISTLTKLRYLDVSNNQINHLTTHIGRMKDLICFNISCNQLGSIPAELCNCTNLELLNIGRNKFLTIPEQMGNLLKLQLFDASHCYLVDVPRSLQGCSSLVSIYLRGNKLTQIPDAIFNCTRLRSLDISYNLIDSIPASIEKLHYLEHLNISHNHLSILPKELATLTMLRELFMEENRICCIDSIGNWLYDKIGDVQIYAHNQNCAFKNRRYTEIRIPVSISKRHEENCKSANEIVNDIKSLIVERRFLDKIPKLYHAYLSDTAMSIRVAECSCTSPYTTKKKTTDSPVEIVVSYTFQTNNCNPLLFMEYIENAIVEQIGYKTPSNPPLKN
jgi:Leucine-rich repeat (LRR) protein